MNKKFFAFLIVVLSLGFALFISGCDSNDVEARRKIEQSKEQKRIDAEERDAERLRAQYDAEKPKTNDGDSYYNTERPEEPKPFPTPTENQLKEVYQNAVQAEKEYKDSVAKRARDQQLSVLRNELYSAFDSFARFSMVKLAGLTDLERVSQLIQQEGSSFYDAYGRETAESILRLHAAQPDNSIVSSILTQVYQGFDKTLRKRLKESNFNISARYTDAFRRDLYNRGINGPNPCGYEAVDFEVMKNLAKAMGKPSEVKLWTLHIADEQAAGVVCEGNGGGDLSDLAYFNYIDAGDQANAKLMALTVAREVLSGYLNGIYGEMDSKVKLRSPFLAKDIEVTKVWLGRAGLSESEMDKWMKDQASKNAKDTEEICRSKGNLYGGVEPCGLAQKQYEFAGDKDSAYKMSLLVPKK